MLPSPRGKSLNSSSGGQFFQERLWDGQLLSQAGLPGGDGLCQQKASVFPAWSHFKKPRERIWEGERESNPRSPVRSIPDYCFTFLTAENRVV